MKQMARNLTMADMGFLDGSRYLLHDRDSKFCASFEQIIRWGGVAPVKLPPLLNASLKPMSRPRSVGWDFLTLRGVSVTGRADRGFLPVHSFCAQVRQNVGPVC